jgi:hypothetical protein
VVHVTAKEQLRQRLDGLTEKQARQALNALEDQGRDDLAERFDALIASAPPDDEPEDYDDDALTEESRAQAARGEVRTLEQVRRALHARDAAS